MFLVPKMPQLTPYADLSVLPPPQLHAFRYNLSSMPSTSSSPPLVLISPPCQLFKPLALLSKPCCPAPPSQLSPFLSSSHPFFATCPPDLPILWCWRFSRKICPCLLMEYLTLEFVYREEFSHHGWCGLGCPGTLASGLEPASVLNKVKFRPT